MSKRGRKGMLSLEDRELWGKVAKTATPLDTERAKAQMAELEQFIDATPKAAAEPPKTSTAIHPPEPAKPAPPPPLRQLEHRYRKKLVRGVKQIDARIDLHGLTQDRAHDRLRGFLYEAQARGHKVVLVITGKGGGPGYAYMDERGVLRRMVPQWLAMPDVRHLVVGYEEAHTTHGGSGALYVRIRRRR
jgi:DNA-nicking Smr family endonuclease